jgi:hypothetical protein
LAEGWRSGGDRCSASASLCDNQLLIALELLLLPALFALQAAGLLAKPKLPLLLLGWLSMWLRGVGWRQVGLARPKSWPRTVLAALAIGLAYEALDILVFLPLLQRLTGEPLDLSQLGHLEGNAGMLALLVLASWVSAALAEELLCSRRRSPGSGFSGMRLRRDAAEPSTRVEPDSSNMESTHHPTRPNTPATDWLFVHCSASRVWHAICVDTASSRFHVFPHQPEPTRYHDEIDHACCAAHDSLHHRLRRQGHESRGPVFPDRRARSRRPAGSPRRDLARPLRL